MHPNRFQKLLVMRTVCLFFTYADSIMNDAKVTTSSNEVTLIAAHL